MKYIISLTQHAYRIIYRNNTISLLFPFTSPHTEYAPSITCSHILSHSLTCSHAFAHSFSLSYIHSFIYTHTHTHTHCSLLSFHSLLLTLLSFSPPLFLLSPPHPRDESSESTAPHRECCGRGQCCGADGGDTPDNTGGGCGREKEEE